MVSPIFSIRYYLGEIIDNVAGIAPTIRGSMTLLNTRKGQAAYTAANANSYQITKTLSGTYSVVAWIYQNTADTGITIVDFRQNPITGTGFILGATGVYSSSSGTIYVDNVQTTASKKYRWQCVIVTGISLACTYFDLFNRNSLAIPLRGFCSNFEIYSGTLTTAEMTEIYNNFVNIRHLAAQNYKVANVVQLYQDFAYAKADQMTKTKMLNFISGTGTFKVVQTTSDLGNYGGMPKGSKYLECVTAGTIAIQCLARFGTFEIDVYKAADANKLEVNFISDRIGAGNAQQGYYFVLGTNENYGLTRSNVGSVNVLTDAPAAYTAIQIWYRIKVVAAINGVFTSYIKGGAFGANYVLADSSAGGTNPTAADLTYTANKFITFDLDAGDRIGKIIVT